jgi:hypothetical protein
MSFSRRHTAKVVVIVLTIGIVLSFSLQGIALAHEERTVGDYTLEFGWRVEPAVTGAPNGPELYVSSAKVGVTTEELLQNVDVSLQVEVTFGPASRTLELSPDAEEIGHYVADLIPTRPGDYTFHVTGTIGETAIDETFTSADGYFDSIEPASDLQFPEPQPDVSELLQRIEALEAEVQALRSGTGQ